MVRGSTRGTFPGQSLARCSGVQLGEDLFQGGELKDGTGGTSCSLGEW